MTAPMPLDRRFEVLLAEGGAAGTFLVAFLPELGFAVVDLRVGVLTIVFRSFAGGPLGAIVGSR